MTIETTPSLLMNGNEKEYIDLLKKEYNQKIIKIPEGKNVVFFLNKDEDCRHFFCGKGGTKMNKLRCKYILFIKYILENKDCRVVKQHKITKNVIFVCNDPKFIIVCSDIGNNNLKCFTYHPYKDIVDFLDQNKYIDYIF